MRMSVSPMGLPSDSGYLTNLKGIIDAIIRQPTLARARPQRL